MQISRINEGADELQVEVNAVFQVLCSALRWVQPTPGLHLEGFKVLNDREQAEQHSVSTQSGFPHVSTLQHQVSLK